MSQRPDRWRSGPDTTPDRSNAESPSHVTDMPMVASGGTGPGIPRQRVPAEPVPLSEVIGGLLELSDERDSWIGQLIAAGQDGYVRGLADGVALGRRLEAAERDRAWNEIAQPISRIDPAFMSRRWAVRGEPRTRETFGRPSAGDFKGRKGTA